MLDYVNMENGLLLDIGGGRGPYKDIFERRGAKYFLCDRKKYPEVDLLFDLNLPFPIRNGSIDFAISTQVLEHLSNPVFTLSEIRRILAPNGALLITVPFFFRLHEEPYDYGRFTFFGLRELLESAKFSSFRIWGHGDELTILFQSLNFALRSLKLPKRIILFLIAINNSLTYIREKNKIPIENPSGNIIGLSAIAKK